MNQVLKLVAVIGIVVLSTLLLMYIFGVLSLTALLANAKVVIAAFAVVSVASVAIARICGTSRRICETDSAKNA